MESLPKASATQSTPLPPDDTGKKSPSTEVTAHLGNRLLNAQAFTDPELHQSFIATCARWLKSGDDEGFIATCGRWLRSKFTNEPNETLIYWDGDVEGSLTGYKILFASGRVVDINPDDAKAFKEGVIIASTPCQFANTFGKLGKDPLNCIFESLDDDDLLNFGKALPARAGERLCGHTMAALAKRAAKRLPYSFVNALQEKIGSIEGWTIVTLELFYNYWKGGVNARTRYAKVKNDKRFADTPLIQVCKTFAEREQESDWLTISVNSFDIKAVTSQLKKGWWTDGADETGRTALHWAAYSGVVNLAKVLLTNGEYVSPPIRRTIVLYRPIINGKVDWVRGFLRRKGVIVNETDANGSTPLFHASYAKELETMRALLEYGADANAADNLGYTPLYWAAHHGEVEAVKLLLDHGADVRLVNAKGETALDCAREKQFTEIENILLNANAKVSAVSEDGMTALHRTPAQGPDINVVDKDGKTPLYLAVEKGHFSMARLLLDYGADVTTTDKYGRTLLHWAVINGQAGLVQILLDKGVDANATDKNGFTALLDAAFRKECVKILRILVDHGANVNVAENGGNTALHGAASIGEVEAVRLLLDNGADPSATNEKGNRPLDLATDETVKQMLREAMQEQP